MIKQVFEALELKKNVFCKKIPNCLTTLEFDKKHLQVFNKFKGELRLDNIFKTNLNFFIFLKTVACAIKFFNPINNSVL
jgi:hypothetical protein